MVSPAFLLRLDSGARATADSWSTDLKPRGTAYAQQRLQQRKCSRCHCSTGLGPQAAAARPFRLGCGYTQQAEHFRQQQTAVVDIIGKHSGATPRLISSHPPRPWKGLGKAGRLPSTAAEVKRLQQCWGCQSIGDSAGICSA